MSKHGDEQLSRDAFEAHFTRSIMAGGYTRRDENGDYVVFQCARHWRTWKRAVAFAAKATGTTP